MMTRDAAGWWAFCDHCGRSFRGGERDGGYMPLTRRLKRHGWQQLPYLDSYCPEHAI